MSYTEYTDLGKGPSSNPKITLAKTIGAILNRYTNGERDITKPEIICDVLGLPEPNGSETLEDLGLSLRDEKKILQCVARARESLRKKYGIHSAPFNERWLDDKYQGYAVEVFFPAPHFPGIGFRFSVTGEKDPLITGWEFKLLGRSLSASYNGVDRAKDSRRRELISKEEHASKRENLEVQYSPRIRLTWNGDENENGK
jgi:hypothetical protein